MTFAPSGVVALSHDAPQTGTPDASPLVSCSISHRPDQAKAQSLEPKPPKRKLKKPDYIEVLPRDVKVIRDYGPQPQPEHLKDCTRGEIEIFSPKSASRLTRLARNASPALVSQFCLTYHQRNPDGKTAKKHLDAWLKCFRRACPGAGYLWILEFQSRGVPHFHVWLTVPYSVDLWKRLGVAWNRIAEPESPEHLWWHTEERTDPRTGRVQRSMLDWNMKGAGYLRKYMSKEAQKCVPAGFGWCGRFWGATRGLVPEPIVFTADDLPGEITDITRTISKWSEARRKRGADFARKRAARKGQKYVRLKLRPTARSVSTSAWVNNSAPMFLQLLDRLQCLDSSHEGSVSLPVSGVVSWDELDSVP